jgi:hypothetical protein
MEAPTEVRHVTDEVIDPLAPDAPIHHLLSLKHNPRLKDMTRDQLHDLVKKIRALATSAPTMSSKLQSESSRRKPRVLTPEQKRKQEILDSI